MRPTSAPHDTHFNVNVRVPIALAKDADERIAKPRQVHTISLGSAAATLRRRAG